MILGSVRDRLPLIQLGFHGQNGVIEVELIVDTGFDGDFVLPGRFIRELGLSPLYMTRRKLTDGTIRESDVYEATVDLNAELRQVEVIRFEHNPLIGTAVLEGWNISIDLREGGQVALEPPD